jgi:hypothetical protein
MKHKPPGDTAKAAVKYAREYGGNSVPVIRNSKRLQRGICILKQVASLDTAASLKALQNGHGAPVAQAELLLKKNRHDLRKMLDEQ